MSNINQMFPATAVTILYIPHAVTLRSSGFCSHVARVRVRVIEKLFNVEGSEVQ